LAWSMEVTLSFPASDSLFYFIAVRFVVSAFCLMKYDCVCHWKSGQKGLHIFLVLGLRWSARFGIFNCLRKTELSL